MSATADILIVDDDASLRAALGDYLSGAPRTGAAGPPNSHHDGLKQPSNRSAGRAFSQA